MNQYLAVLKKYAAFDGRARRKEFWMFALVSFIVVCILSVLDMALGFGLFTALYTLAVLVPSLAVGARRLHDTGRSGWWLLLALIPVIGILVLIVFWVLDGNPGDNAYGPNPKAGG